MSAKKMKAWYVNDRENFSQCTVYVFAETKGKAVSEALGRDEYPGCDWTFIELRAKRAPALDKYYRGSSILDWDNAEDRIALVKEGYVTCDREWMETLGECPGCPARVYCEQRPSVEFSRE